MPFTRGAGPVSFIGAAGPELDTRGDQIIGRAGRAVPPTVISLIRIMGIPTPTGTLCPSLPQVPTPGSSDQLLPTRVTLARSLGPLPMRVAFLTGRPILPFSIR